MITKSAMKIDNKKIKNYFLTKQYLAMAIELPAEVVTKIEYFGHKLLRVFKHSLPNQ